MVKTVMFFNMLFQEKRDPIKIFDSEVQNNFDFIQNPLLVIKQHNLQLHEHSYNIKLYTHLNLNYIIIKLLSKHSYRDVISAIFN